MFHSTLKGILIALQDGNANKAIDKCTKAMTWLEKFQKLDKIKNRGKDNGNKI